MKIGCRGSSVIDVVIGAAILVFILLPVFSVIIEKYILQNKVEMIKDAADITNISVYNAMNVARLGKTDVVFEQAEATEVYKQLLSANLKLDSDLKPLADSIAEGQVVLESLEFYTAGFPIDCPQGNRITRPAVHSSLRVPVKPSLYRKILLDLLGKSSIELKIHVDSDIPVNN